MESADTGSLVMGSSSADKMRLVALVLGVWVVLFVGTQFLGFNPLIALALIAVATVRLWWGAFVVFTAPPPALLADGVRLRRGRSGAVVPWSQILSLGLVRVSRMSRMYLEVMTSNSMEYPGPRKDGVNFVYLSPGVVTPEQVRDAVARLTHGQVPVTDEPYRRTVAG